MNNRITKEKITRHLEYDWFKYILIMIACILIWWGIFSLIDNPKSYERIDLFVTLSSAEVKSDGQSAVQKEIENMLDDAGDKVVRKVSVINFEAQEQLLTTMLSSDIVIFEKLHLEIAVTMLELTEEVFGYIGISKDNYKIAADENGILRVIRIEGIKILEWLPKTILDGDEERDAEYYIGIMGYSSMVGGGDNLGRLNKERYGKNNGQSFTVTKGLLQYFLS